MSSFFMAAIPLGLLMSFMMRSGTICQAKPDLSSAMLPDEFGTLWMIIYEHSTPSS